MADITSKEVQRGERTVCFPLEKVASWWPMVEGVALQWSAMALRTKDPRDAEIRDKWDRFATDIFEAASLLSPPTSSSVEMVAVPRSKLAEVLNTVVVERERVELTAQIEPRGRDENLSRAYRLQKAEEALSTALKGQTPPAQETHLFPRVWTYIRDHGKADPPPANRLGGIWSADIYRLGNAVAGLYSDGSERRITAPGLDVWEEYSGKPVYKQGTPEMLGILFVALKGQGGTET